MARKKHPEPSWKNIRSVLTKASRKDLLSLVGDLYTLRKENQNFLHARFIKDKNTLSPYKDTIEQYVSPAEPWKLDPYRKSGELPPHLACHAFILHRADVAQI